jgi:hypothetical protein
MQEPRRGGIVAPTHSWLWPSMGLVISITPKPRFTSGEKTPDTHWVGGWVGFDAGLDTDVRGKILCPCRRSNHSRPVCSQTLHLLSYQAPEVCLNTIFKLSVT